MRNFKVSLLWGWLLFLLTALAFKPLFSPGSLTHREITQIALLRKTAAVCRAMAIARGEDFSLPTDDSLNEFMVQKACTGKSSIILGMVFKAAVVKMYLSNAIVDSVFAMSHRHHFDAESFIEARKLVVQGMATVKASVKQNFIGSARIRLGLSSHTLQDFYSHSNWIEMGNTEPFSILMSEDVPFKNLAAPTRATCRNCVGGDCRDNILPDIIEEKILTSGYFSLYSSVKPAGKCSHGGFFDQTSRRNPIGGINKDDKSSSHGYLHFRAAHVAINATLQLLEDIRLATGDREFLRLMGISQSSAVCFVVGTTEGMSKAIEEIKRLSSTIIDKRGIEHLSEYILVPFSDPGFGPLLSTANASLFKEHVHKLQVSGGGDLAKMSFSGLLLALTAAPPASHIYIFTDASAKDQHLKSTVAALIESSKCKVSFVLLNSLSSRRRQGLQGRSTRSSPADGQLYHELAQASGGQVIEVTRSSLSQAMTIIEDSTSAAQVTLLQAARSLGKAEKFLFMLDESVSNVTIHITGSSTVFTIYSPSGKSQSHLEAKGLLGSIQSVGNLWIIHLNFQTGWWRIGINSTNTYTVKVTGHSPIDFLYNIVEASEGAYGGFSLKEGRPSAARSATLLISVMGDLPVDVTEVALVEASGAVVINSTVQTLGREDFLVTIDKLPQGVFSVRMRGHTSGNRFFERQSPTQLTASKVTVKAELYDTVEPGTVLTVPFMVTTSGQSGDHIIRVWNSRDFSTSFPHLIYLETGGSAEGMVTISIPSDATSGTEVTLTIEAQSPEHVNSNYALLHLVIVTKTTDLKRPVCEVTSIKADCPQECSFSTWELSASLMDVNGTGIERVAIKQGNGTLSTRTTVTGEILMSYTASCCSEVVELVSVDGAGNVATCLASIPRAFSDNANS
ncbi:von Willebrand factor A domain-containing protein 7-like [Denticeps clupeoides]|uniref:von Willebrand factor A domain-containing protein 7-like n=1 Tax=Denticeps clupeoides TaxID=299321 RepID=UPI0010A4ACFB|nr:von Willebrand factor A domain-containing protein 7-like [Denticeps clupeoides]